MSEEENTFKANMPLLKNEEIRYIDNNFESIVDKITKASIHNKDLAVMQYIIENQQAEIEEYKKTIAQDNKKYEQMKKSLKGTISKQNAELEKKDKIIDETIKYIYSFLHGHLDYISDDIAGNKRRLKQYFEKKLRDKYVKRIIKKI